MSATPTDALLRTPNIGTAALEDRDRFNFGQLREARRTHVLDEMERLGLDALILGREANVRYASGARRLWTAGSRPFGPTCVAVHATGHVHVMSFSASYEGAAEDTPFEDVYSVSMNPAVLLARVAAIPGMADARTIGVDGFSLFMRDLLVHAAPNATFVGAEPHLRALRRHKLPAEITAIRTAVAIGEAALSAAITALRPGITGRELQAAYLARMCEVGTSQFAQQGTFGPIDPGLPLMWITSDRRIESGSLVALAGGALWAGYEGSLARTWWCGTNGGPTGEQQDLHRRWRRAIDAMSARCLPGATGADLVHAHVDSGEPLPAMTVAYAVGLGHEGSIAGTSFGPDFDARQVLHAGMVVALRTFVTGEAGGYFGEEMVLVRDDGPEVLTRLSHGPLAEQPRAR